MISIEPLSLHPARLPELVAWYEKAWAPYYKDGPGDAKRDLEARLDAKKGAPYCVLALDNDTQRGTACLRDSSISHPDLGPWLTGMLPEIEAPHTQQIRQRLIAAIETEAWNRGAEALYTSVDESQAQSFLVRDWQTIGTATSLRGEIDVYRRKRP